MKVKSLIKLGIVAVLIVVVAFLALNGLQVGKYILKPVGSAISLGLDLRGGVSTAGKIAVVGGIVIVLVISLLNSRQEGKRNG